MLKETILATDFLEDYFRRIGEASSAVRKDYTRTVDHLKRKIGSLDYEIDRLVDAFADGTLTNDGVKGKVQQAQEEKREAEAALRPIELPTP